MPLIVVDCETDGPIPGKYSMVCFGAVIVDPKLNNTFYGKTKPISDNFNPDALAISGFSRNEHLTFDDPSITVTNFAEWIKKSCKGKPIFISDNNGFDFAWINWYFHSFYGSNPFGYSSRRISDLFCGAEHDLYYKWKQFRKTVHDHNPVSDSLGNAEALLYLFDKYQMKLPK